MNETWQYGKMGFGLLLLGITTRHGWPWWPGDVAAFGLFASALWKLYHNPSGTCPMDGSGSLIQDRSKSSKDIHCQATSWRQ